MIVRIFNRQRTLALTALPVRRLVTHVLAQEGKTCDEVSIYFVNTPTICRLHADYFNDPSPTDCISFPLDEADDDEGFPYRVLGDVFVCPETAVKYAQSRSLDPYHEVTLYIVHGLLHLMGYDDMNPICRRRMRRAEKRHLQALITANLQLNCA